MRSLSIKGAFAVMAAFVLVLALTQIAFSQAAPAGQAGQRGAATGPAGQAGQGGQQGQGGRGGQGQGAQAGRGGQGGRGGAPAPPSPPTPRRADGSPIMGSMPGQPTGRWSGCCTTMTQGQTEKIPFQPWAKAVYDQRQIDQFEPHTRCKASGASRQFSTPYGTELLEAPDYKRIYIMDEGGPHSYRIIYMDGRSHPANLEPTNYGHSIGHFEGDTLVVDTIGYNEKFWIDTRGTPHTEKLHFVERFTRKDFNTMEYVATIDDPGAYTAPWTSGYTLGFTRGAELFEYQCQENNLSPESMVGDALTSAIVP